MEESAHLRSELQALGVDAQSAEDVSQITLSLGEALELLGRAPDGRISEAAQHWKEYFSVKNQRLYYCNSATGANQWDAPPCVLFREWQLDAALYGLELPLAQALFLALEKLLMGAGHPPQRAYEALGVLCKLVGNVVDCDNSQEKFRTVRLSNPRIQQSVWEVAGAPDVLSLVGFRRQGDCLVLPADAPLGPLQAAAARMRRLADRKGHRGKAEAVQEEGASSSGQGRPPSEFYGKPGFRYQEQIWHCSVCHRPINDGSERLWTGHHEAPKGEYRYRCTTCEDKGAIFDLCQDCWDSFQAQQQQQQQQQQQGGQRGQQDPAPAARPLHPPLHAFQHVGPRMTRHNDYYNKRGGGSDKEGGTDSSNPWGRSGAGGGYARGLQRLQERYGVRF